MGILKLGVLSSLLSDSLMSGFTTGSAFHVLTSQVPHLLGYRIPKITGVGRLVKVGEVLLPIGNCRSSLQGPILN